MEIADIIQSVSSFTGTTAQVEQLPPIMEFLSRYDRSSLPYPVQATLLKIAFLEIDELDEFDRMVIREWQRSTENGGDVQIPLDIYDRMRWCKEHGYTNFNTFIYCGGRRGGKGYIGGKMGAYKLAQLLSYGSPQNHFGIDQGDVIQLDVFANTFRQAQEALYADIKDSIISNDWLSPYIVKAGSQELLLATASDKLRYENFKAESKEAGRQVPSQNMFATLKVTPLASAPETIRGHPAIMQDFDEFAHATVKEGTLGSNDLYEAATPSTLQFGREAMIYIPSSPWSRIGKFYELYEQAFLMDAYGHAENPQMFAIKIPSWELYRYWEYDKGKRQAIILSPEESRETRQKELANPEAFDVEFRANFADTEASYLSPAVIQSLFQPFPSQTDNRNVPAAHSNMTFNYVAHADAGRSQDNFCFAMGHREKIDGYWHVFIDAMHVWQAQDFPEDERGIRVIDYTRVFEWIEGQFRLFPIAKYTMDQWNSAYILDQLRRDAFGKGRFLNPTPSISVDTHGRDENFRRWESFKTACYQGWVHIPRQKEFIYKVNSEVCLAEEELRWMVLKNGREIGYPAGAPIQHEDMSECVATVVVNLIGSQIDGDEDDYTALIGGAPGGYNQVEDVAQTQEDIMRELGYL